MKILFASQNQHKIEEVSKILPSQIKVIGLRDVSFKGEIPETQKTIEGNALQKVRFIHDKYGIPCFADDTGLFINTLKGEPGIYSARWSDGEERFKNNIEKALFKLRDKEDRTAYFRTVIAYIDKNKKEYLFEGKIDGYILATLRGEEGFGYDPIFIPNGNTLTFAEMSSQEKNKISHRGLAMNDFIKHLESY